MAYMKKASGKMMSKTSKVGTKATKKDDPIKGKKLGKQPVPKMTKPKAGISESKMNAIRNKSLTQMEKVARAEAKRKQKEEMPSFIKKSAAVGTAAIVGATKLANYLKKKGKTQ